MMQVIPNKSGFSQKVRKFNIGFVFDRQAYCIV